MIYIREDKSKKVCGTTSLFISFKYNTILIDIIKSCNYGIWHANTLEWEVPIFMLSFLLDNFIYYDDIDLKVLEGNNNSDDIEPSFDYKIEPFQHQKDAIKFGLSNSHKKWLLLDSPGLGKMEPISSIIPTPMGFKKMGDIIPGDRVFSSSGQECNVLQTFYHKNKDIYRVTFSDNTTVDCGLDHLWIVRDGNMKRRNQGWKVLSLKEMLQMGLQYKGHTRKGANKFEIPIVNPIQYKEKNYLIHPYILGMFISEGDITDEVISIPDIETESTERVKNLLPNNAILVEDKHSSCHRCSIQDFSSKIISELKRLELNVTNHQKFIPEEYKLGSVEQRLDLLRGLMDLGGSIKSGTRIQFNTTSKQLADDVCELINSLGGTAKIRVYDRTKELRIEYKVLLKLPINPFYLKREAEKYTPSSRYRVSRHIVSAVLVKKEDAKCLMVDSSDSSYITGKTYTVTHNTATVIHIAEELKNKKNIEHCLIICGVASLRANWEKEIKFHSNLSSIIIGKNINSKGNVTWSTIKDRAAQLKNTIDEFFVIINIESLRDKSIVNAINTSKNKFNMIVVDEIHKCSGKSLQSSNLLKIKPAEYQIGMTGTLLVNSPINAFVPLKWLDIEHSTLSTFKSTYCSFGGFGGREIVGYKNLEFLKEELEQNSLRRTKDLVSLPPKNVIDEYIEMNDAHRQFYDNVRHGVKEECDKIELNTKNLLALMTRLRQASTCPSVLTTEQITGSKISRCVELVNDIIEQGDKCVVMSSFKEPLDVLYKELKQFHPLLCTGDKKDSDVSDDIDKFQKDDIHKVMLCTNSKMGTGVTLNRARYLIMLDEPYTYAEDDQIQCRIHRVNNTKPVFIYKLICERTVDERIHAIVQTKKALSDYIIDKDMSSTTTALLKILKDEIF